MSEEQLQEKIAETKTEYFRAADSALKNLEQKFGTGREGFLNFLNNNVVGEPKAEEP